MMRQIVLIALLLVVGTYSQTCTTGFYFNNGLCVACPQRCSACTSADLCTACKSTFFLTFFGECYPCPDGQYYSSERNACFRCKDECAACTGFTSCTLCKPGWFLLNNVCLDEDPNPRMKSGFQFLISIGGALVLAGILGGVYLKFMQD